MRSHHQQQYSDLHSTSNRLLAVYSTENIVLQIDCINLHEALLSQLHASSSPSPSPSSSSLINRETTSESLALSPQDAARKIGLHKWCVRSSSRHDSSEIVNVLFLSSQVMDVAFGAASLPSSDAVVKWIISGTGTPSQFSDPTSFFGGRWKTKDSRYVPSHVAIDPSLPSWQQWRQWQTHLSATKHLEMMVINSDQPMVSFFSIAVEPPSFLQSAAVALAANVANKAQKITSSIFSMAKSWWSSNEPSSSSQSQTLVCLSFFLFFPFIGSIILSNLIN